MIISIKLLKRSLSFSFGSILNIILNNPSPAERILTLGEAGQPSRSRLGASFRVVAKSFSHGNQNSNLIRNGLSSILLALNLSNSSDQLYSAGNRQNLSF